MPIMKSRLLKYVTIAAVAMTISLCGGLFPINAHAEGEIVQVPTKRTLSVSGQGIIYVSPDIAYITLGIITQNENAKIAQQNNAETMSEIITSIKSAGVKSEDIKTVNYSIQPDYSYNKETGESKIIGYSVNNSIQVTVRDITKTGDIIDLATDSGLNVTSSISFGLSDYEKYYNEALKSAVSKAKKRAETIAAVLGVTVDTPVSVYESGGYEPVYNYNYAYMSDMKTSASASTPIESGTITVKANVSLSYEY